MQFSNSFEKIVPNITDLTFNGYAKDLFHYQAQNNLTYREYLSHLDFDINRVTSINDIPFLPIKFFKDHEVKTDSWKAEKFFLSSGTTGMKRSRHAIRSVDHYLSISKQIFELNYGPIVDYTIMALLPSYLEQGDSSLITMCDHLIRLSEKNSSQYVKIDEVEAYLNEFHNRKIILIGVTYALLEVQLERVPNMDLTVMETGGMKGRGKEMTRQEVHRLLAQKFGNDAIHSEYGMTELCSQAYSKGEGKLNPPPWMRVMVRDVNDPFTRIDKGKTGGINIIDLANVHSCAFIETEDLGRLNEDGSFEIFGRFDNSDLRGCNMLTV